MSHPASPSESDLPLPWTECIDALCLEFEDAWQRGESPEISAWLARIDPDARGPLLTELVVLDVTYRRLKGQDCDLRRYTKAHPDHRGRIEAAFNQLECLDAVSDLAPGTELGRYTIECKLGSGGFATVYRALDQELQRRVAIKSVRRDREATDADFQRLMEEARTVARLSHPGIVPVYDVLRSGDGVCIVMEYIAGPSLKETLSAGPLAPPRAGELAAALCDALSHAHRSGFVHRDLKPSNILLDEAGHPHIADFGLAVHDSNVPGLRGQRAGSAAYMAPEQVRGEADRLDGRADIWAIGVLLYEMLAGRRPFEGETPAQQQSAIQSREPKPLRQIDPAIPATLAAICTRCLNKAPAERYATAADIAAELRGALTERTHPVARAALPQLGFRGGAALGAGLGLVLLFALWLLAPELIWPSDKPSAAAPILHSGDDPEAIRDKLEAIAYAFHFHHDAFGMFTQPLAGDGAPRGSRLSWRVHLLPYLDQQPLYEQFRLDEPWDSAHNLPLLDQMPDAYRVGPMDGALTRFRVVTGPEALFGPGRRPRLADLRDGASNTILAVAIGPDRAAAWTKPDNLTLDGAMPLSALGNLPHQSLECVMADMTLLSLPEEAAARFLPALITPAGGEVTSGETLRRTYGPQREPNVLLKQKVRDVLDRRRQSQDKLKRIVLALHNFHDTYRQFPPPKSAKLSWRVHLLPFLDQGPLYRQFKLDEPWDSPHNLPLRQSMPDVYREWDDPPDSADTRVVVLTGPHTAYLNTEGPRLRDFTDGPSNTILVLRAGRDRAAAWTKPQDIVFEPTAPVACLGKFDEPGFLFATTDGAVRRLKTSVPAALFLPLVTPAGGETLSPELRDYGFR